jgi:hypothetical protein
MQYHAHRLQEIEAHTYKCIYDLRTFVQMYMYAFFPTHTHPHTNQTQTKTEDNTGKTILGRGPRDDSTSPMETPMEGSGVGSSPAKPFLASIMAHKKAVALPADGVLSHRLAEMSEYSSFLKQVCMYVCSWDVCMYVRGMDIHACILHRYYVAEVVKCSTF